MGYEDAVKEERELDRILSFSLEEQEAFRAVQLMLCAIGCVHESKGAQVHFDLEEAHKFFKIYVARLKLQGPYFATDSEYSPAVTLYFGKEELKPGSFMMIIPWIRYAHAKWRIDEHPDREAVLEAAREVCRVWLPSWDW